MKNSAVGADVDIVVDVGEVLMTKKLQNVHRLNHSSNVDVDMQEHFVVECLCFVVVVVVVVVVGVYSNSDVGRHNPWLL